MPIEFAVGSTSPVWPLPAVTRRRWTFGAPRGGGALARRHAGVDLYAPRGSVVLAPEAGKIVAIQPFNGPKAVAMLIQTDTGPVILLGEIEPNSWDEFGLSRGSRVRAGQEVARVGINPGGSQMLHFEMYRQGTTRNHSWPSINPPPGQLLNPERYLKTAKALDASQDDPNIEDEDDTHDDSDSVVPPLPDIRPPELPVGPPQLPPGQSQWGLIAIAILGVLLIGEMD